MELIQCIHTVTEPTRYKILQLLSEHNYCVCAIAKKLGISASAVSQHMRVLKQAGVVSGQKLGYQMHYRINRDALINLFSGLSRQFPTGNDALLQAECSCEFSDSCVKLAVRLREEAGHAK